MPANGQLADSELVAIPGGRLRKPAADAWNAKGGPADKGLRPSGPNASYRELGVPGGKYGTQWWFYQHQPPIAAYPGTSVHGFGEAVDLLEQWMRAWIDDHGARFGWKKTEAWSEWWHVNFVGGVDPKLLKRFKSLKKGNRGKRVQWYTKRLAFIHEPHGKAYLRRWYWRYKQPVVEAVKEFQRDHGLAVDGVIGEKTAHKISEVFHRQYINRKGKRKRTLRVAARETLAELRHGKQTQHA